MESKDSLVRSFDRLRKVFMDVRKQKITKPFISWTIFTFAVILIFSLNTCSTKNLLNSQKAGSIFVNSTPPGGNIILDHVLLAGTVTPDTIFDVTVGEHVVSVTKEGYLPAPDSLITVEENEIDTVEFVLLNTLYGSLKVTSNVDSATICIDKKDTTEVTPHIFFNHITVGTHIISIFKEGYSNQEPAKEVINIVTEDTVEVSFLLNPAVVGKVVGNITPDFKLEDDYGEWHRSYAHRGFVTMINFWATDCPNCMTELPYLQKIYTDYLPDSLIIFGINYWEDFNIIRETRKELGLDFTLLRDEGSKVKKEYDLPGTPVTIILDRGGKICLYQPGFDPSSMPGKFRKKLDELFGR